MSGRLPDPGLVSPVGPAGLADPALASQVCADPGMVSPVGPADLARPMHAFFLISELRLHQ